MYKVKEYSKIEIDLMENNLRKAIEVLTPAGDINIEMLLQKTKDFDFKKARKIMVGEDFGFIESGFVYLSLYEALESTIRWIYDTLCFCNSKKLSEAVIAVRTPYPPYEKERKKP